MTSLTSFHVVYDDGWGACLDAVGALHITGPDVLRITLSEFDRTIVEQKTDPTTGGRWWRYAASITLKPAGDVVRFDGETDAPLTALTIDSTKETHLMNVRSPWQDGQWPISAAMAEAFHSGQLWRGAVPLW